MIIRNMKIRERPMATGIMKFRLGRNSGIGASISIIEPITIAVIPPIDKIP